MQADPIEKWTEKSNLTYCQYSLFGKKSKNTKYTEMLELSPTITRQYIDAVAVFDALTEATEEAAQF